jgi:hypothetical protein
VPRNVWLGVVGFVSASAVAAPKVDRAATFTEAVAAFFSDDLTPGQQQMLLKARPEPDYPTPLARAIDNFFTT